VFSLPLYQMRGYGRITQSAGTAIVRLIEPVLNAFTRLTDLWYTAGATAHTLTILRALNKTTVPSVTAGGQTSITLAADPGKFNASGFVGGTINVADIPIAANHYVVYQCADGTFFADTVSSVSGLTLTMTSNVPAAGIAAGAPFWFFGALTSNNPSDGNPHPQFTLPASGVTKFGGDPGEGIAGFVGTLRQPSSSLFGANWPLTGQFEPMLIVSNNITNAGTLEKVTAIYSTK
jgi:hypothetical protein